MNDRENRPVALVTGAGSGIGRTVSEILLADGYRLVLSGRREEPLRETAAAAADPDDVLVCPADVSSESDVARLFGDIVQQFGRLDLLFNNAGIPTARAPFPEVTLEDFEANLRVNVVGSFLCAREAFRVMSSQDPAGGRIINNGSVSAQVPRPQAVSYNVAKSAVTGLTKSISLDGRGHGIACGQIDIGNAVTEMSLGNEKSGAALQADGSGMIEPKFDVKHVGEAIRYMANLPLGANVQFITLIATEMPLVGRG